MNNVSITISANDNRTHASGYDAKFYADVNARNADITNDLNLCKERFGDRIAIIAVAEWDDTEGEGNSSGLVYHDIDEVMEAYKPIETGIEE